MRKKKAAMKYDPLTTQIQKLLARIPKLGGWFIRLYLWRFMLFNFMFIGATGVILQFVLYEGIFRMLFLPFLGGTLLAMIVTTTIVFLWNYKLNRKWGLSATAQIMSMKKHELQDLRDAIDRLLQQKFDQNGSRV